MQAVAGRLSPPPQASMKLHGCFFGKEAANGESDTTTYSASAAFRAEYERLTLACSDRGSALFEHYLQAR